MTKNADFGPNLAVFGPKILIFMGVSKSFGTNITDASELLNSSVELLEVPGEYLKKTDSNNPRIVI